MHVKKIRVNRVSVHMNLCWGGAFGGARGGRASAAVSYFYDTHEF